MGVHYSWVFTVPFLVYWAEISARVCLVLPRAWCQVMWQVGPAGQRWLSDKGHVRWEWLCYVWGVCADIGIVGRAWIITCCRTNSRTQCKGRGWSTAQHNAAKHSSFQTWRVQNAYWENPVAAATRLFDFPPPARKLRAAALSHTASATGNLPKNKVRFISVKAERPSHHVTTAHPSYDQVM